MHFTYVVVLRVYCLLLMTKYIRSSTLKTTFNMLKLKRKCLAVDFCRFCVVIRVFFIPATTANDLRLRRFSSVIISLTFTRNSREHH